MRALWLVLAGCGRFSFDPQVTGDGGGGSHDGQPCSPVGHDEDGDGVDDACDLCPHKSGPHEDFDADGVGDECDPHPSGRDRIAFFDPFISLRPEWTHFGTTSFSFINDQLVADVRNANLGATLDVPEGVDTFLFAGTIVAGSMSNPRQLLVAEVAEPFIYYYCELYDTGSPSFALTYADGVGFNQLVSTTADSVDTGEFELLMHNEPPMVQCRTTFTVGAPILEAPIPPITPIEFRFDIKGVSVRLDYFIQIHTD